MSQVCWLVLHPLEKKINRSFGNNHKKTALPAEMSLQKKTMELPNNLIENLVVKRDRGLYRNTFRSRGQWIIAKRYHHTDVILYIAMVWARTLFECTFLFINGVYKYSLSKSSERNWELFHPELSEPRGSFSKVLLTFSHVPQSTMKMMETTYSTSCWQFLMLRDHAIV